MFALFASHAAILLLLALALRDDVARLPQLGLVVGPLLLSLMPMLMRSR